MTLSSAELARLLEQSRAHNLATNITGMLLYDGYRFLQVLEGSAAAVATTFARISIDCRHTDVQVLANGPVSQRQFSRWAMGLVSYVTCPEIGFDDLQPAIMTIKDAALCMLLRDFQRYADTMQRQRWV